MAQSNLGGWVKIHRNIIDWEWYDDIPTKVLFLHLLLVANHADQKWHGIEIKRGEKLTSLQVLSAETRLTVRQVRVALDKLKTTGEVTDKSTNKYRLIKVINYDQYQTNDKQSDSQVTSRGQASDKQMTTNKNEKNVRREEGEETVALAPGSAPVSEKEKKKFGNPQVNYILDSVEKITGLPPKSGEATRRYAWNWLRALEKLRATYPERYGQMQAEHMAEQLIALAHGLGDTWHAPKAGDLGHMYKNWQEIAKLHKAKAEKTNKPIVII